MAAKRKRDDANSSASAASQGLSAIAAARLRAGATGTATFTDEVTRGETWISLKEGLEYTHKNPGFNEEVGAIRETETHKNPSRKIKFCNWQNSSEDILSDSTSELTINLKKHDTIALLGCFKFRVLRGAVNINGANITATDNDAYEKDFHFVLIPTTHSIPKFRGLDSTNHIQFLTCIDWEILISNSPYFPGLENNTCMTRSFKVITDSETFPSMLNLRPEVIPEDWARAIEDCSITAAITAIIGPSNSGKSSFAKRLLNRYLTGLGKNARPMPFVYYLDLDPVKPEYTPSGQISLVLVRDIRLDPGIALPVTDMDHMKPAANRVIRAHPVPTQRNDYSSYYNMCLEDLFLTYKAVQSAAHLPPLIINTPGHLFDLEFTHLLEALSRVNPQNIVHLNDPQSINVETADKLHSLQTKFPQYSITIHNISAQSPLSTANGTSVDKNAIRVQSDFQFATDRKQTGETRGLTSISNISHLAPWDFCYRETGDRLQDIVGFAMYNEPVDPASLIHVLNGSMIYIIQTTSPAIPSPYTGLPRTSRYKIPYFPKSLKTAMVDPFDPRMSRLICPALISSFDPDKNTVRVLVPRTHEPLLYTLFPEQTVFVGGCADVPEWAYAGNSLSVKRSGDGDTSELLWMERTSAVERMGYLNTVRRVRKYQT